MNESLKAKQLECLEAVRNGDTGRTGELWELLLPFSNSFIARYLRHNNGSRCYDEDDLRQETYFALLQALEIWKPEKGEFLTAYTWMIQKRLRTASGLNGKDPIIHATSLDKPLDNEDDISMLSEIIPDKSAEQQFDNVDQAEYLSKTGQILNEICENQLNDKQKQVIKGKYYGNKALSELSEDMGVSFQRCSQIEKEALKIFQRPDNMKRIVPYYVTYSGTGLQAFKDHQSSCVERDVERRLFLEHMAAVDDERKRINEEMNAKIQALKTRFNLDALEKCQL